MSDVVIQVENLTKEYRLGTINHGTLYKDLQSWWARLRGSEDPNSLVGHHPSSVADPAPLSRFLALDEVSFEVKQGDVVGIIGRNGAGKSTLLKILSQVTSPTSGVVKLNGRVASLLEVGTGFHPELTGRENVFLNGAILGMSKAEITRKFDEIVAFAEIEKFIDTPVKRYSSGMYVRLAFAVAAHLEPEILIVDEVLAVGDAQFQKKCLGKMESVGKEGRTVLFVSHNMGAIRQLCTRGILLRNGTIVYEGYSSEVADYYLKESIGSNDIFCGERHFAEDLNKDFQVESVYLKNYNNEISTKFDCDEPVHLVINCISRKSIPGLYGCLVVLSRDGQTICHSDSMDIQPNRLDALQEGRHRITITIPARSLAHGDYVLKITFGSSQSIRGFLVDLPMEVVAFQLEDLSSLRGNNRPGFFSTLLAWQTDQVE